MQTFPAGWYYVGDPCYLTENKTLEIIWSHDTAYGDGIYRDNKYNFYHVDSGMIAVVPVDSLPDDAEIQWGNIARFRKPFSCEYSKGTFKIGSLRIYTAE